MTYPVRQALRAIFEVERTLTKLSLQMSVTEEGRRENEGVERRDGWEGLV